MTKDPRFKKIFRVDSVMMISAFRYALGRRTPIVSRTVDMILTNWDKFTPIDKDLMVKEIFEYKKDFGTIGSKYDELDWNRIVERQLEEYKNKRQYEQD
jgi:hypothetical protein